MRIFSCPNGHVMSYVTCAELVLINPDYHNGCRCDICHVCMSIDYNFTHDRIYHCSLCNYDVCQNCSNGNM